MSIFRFLTVVTITAALSSGCTAFISKQPTSVSEPLASHALGIADEVPACLDQLNAANKTGAELDSARIRLVSWNVKKGSNDDWQEDFGALAAGRDLILVQEAIWHPNSSFSEHHWAFAPGYRSRKHLSGVMTYSNSEPLVQCNLISWEPWLGTPKATNITEYGLTGSEQTVLVVNIHAINFTFGVADFTAQIERIRPILAAHAGPIILSGDFNTWRRKRSKILHTFVGEFDLNPVEFDDDYRKAFFGQPLDHIFVRGLRVSASRTRQLTSSDHNPLLAEFSL